MRPDPCMGECPCQNTKTEKCCWHSDIRTVKEKNTIYFDMYGDVDLTTFDMTIPEDIYYCPSCKVTKESTVSFINNIMKTLAPKIQERQQIELKEKELANLELLLAMLAKRKNYNKTEYDKWKITKNEVNRKKKNMAKIYKDSS
jgi:hypothetical protein